MTVYVDDMLRPFGRMLMSHLFADTVEELHEFARKIGCRRSWFQDRTGFPHYDVPKFRRELALDNGAVAIRYRDLPRMLKALGYRKPATRERRGPCASETALGRGSQASS